MIVRSDRFTASFLNRLGTLAIRIAAQRAYFAAVQGMAPVLSHGVAMDLRADRIFGSTEE